MKKYINVTPQVTFAEVQDNKEITLDITYDADALQYYSFFKTNNKWGYRHLFFYRTEPKHIIPPKTVKPISSHDDVWAFESINNILAELWDIPKLIEVTITLGDKKTVYAKDAKNSTPWVYHDGKKMLPISTKRPYKMQSKPMKHHVKANKSNSLIKSCKCMTGDVTVLGKNFNRLI